MATTCKSGAGELVGKTAAKVAAFVDGDGVAGCITVSPSILKAACVCGITAVGCVKLPPNPSALNTVCVNEVVDGGCIKPPPNPSRFNPPCIIDETTGGETSGCTGPPSPRTLNAAFVDDVAGSCIRPPPNPSTLTPPCWLDTLPGVVAVLGAAIGSPTSAVGTDESVCNPTTAAGLEVVCKGAATGKPTREAGLGNAAGMLSAAANGGPTNAER